MSQNELIYEYLKEHGSITAKEAVEHFHCYRLSARIHDLKEQGIRILGRTETTHRNGRACNFTRYVLWV